MTSASKGGIDFSHLMSSGYDLMESAGRQWMDAFKRYVPDATEREAEGALPGIEMVRAWQQWYLGPFNNRSVRTPNMQLLSKICMDQQKRCADLTIAWWKCSLKAMQAIGNGVRNGEQPSEIMKECFALSEEYVRSCADFIAAQSEALSGNDAVAPEGGREKAKPAK